MHGVILQGYFRDVLHLKKWTGYARTTQKQPTWKRTIKFLTGWPIWGNDIYVDWYTLIQISLGIYVVGKNDGNIWAFFAYRGEDDGLLLWYVIHTWIAYI